MDFHSHSCGPRHPKQTPTITFIVIVDSQEWVPNAPLMLNLLYNKGITLFRRDFAKSILVEKKLD